MISRIKKQLNINHKPFDCLKGGTIQDMNLKSDENKNLKTSQPTTGGCRMKQIRSLILFLLAGTFLIAGFSGPSALAIVTAPFSDSSTVEVTLIPILDTVHVGADSIYIDSVKQVKAGKEGVVAYKFKILNGSAVTDTLTSITLNSFNDSASVFSKSRAMEGRRDGAGRYVEGEHRSRHLRK